MFPEPEKYTTSVFAVSDCVSSVLSEEESVCVEEELDEELADVLFDEDCSEEEDVCADEELDDEPDDAELCSDDVLFDEDCSEEDEPVALLLQAESPSASARLRKTVVIFFIVFRSFLLFL